MFANGTVYIVNGDQLETLRTSDGALVWSWTIPAEEVVLNEYGIVASKNLLVTDNVLFAGFRNHVYAIDLASRQVVWSSLRGGHLSLSSNEVLYITGGAARMLFAYNVK